MKRIHISGMSHMAATALSDIMLGPFMIAWLVVSNSLITCIRRKRSGFGMIRTSGYGRCRRLGITLHLK